jgi:Domain of unknown function (DUF4157)
MARRFANRRGQHIDPAAGESQPVAAPAEHEPLAVEPAWTRGLRGRPAGGLFSHDIGLQTKGAISQPGDPHERAADEIAAQVVHGESAPLARAADRGAPAIGQAGGSTQPAAAIPAVSHGLSGGGKPLDNVARATMEQRMGQDFGQVRVHVDERAAESAEALDALAYTTGQHIVFNAGQYAPESGAGQRLLAHELAHVVQQRAAASPTRPLVQRTPKLQENLQKKYKITIESGNKDWSEGDLKDLEWSLGKLSKKEAAVLQGYRFLRWSTPADRQKADPSYQPPEGDEECGLHEPNIKTKTYKISMYDQCFDKSSTMADVPIGRFNIMHEIGHSMEIAALRKAWESYKTAEDAYNAAIDEYNAADAKKQPAIKKKVDTLKKAMDAAEKIYDAVKPGSKTSTLEQFEQLVAGKDPLTEYSKKSSQEALAEAFALYKADPEGIKKTNPKLYEWFKSQSYLGN